MLPVSFNCSAGVGSGFDIAEKFYGSFSKFRGVFQTVRGARAPLKDAKLHVYFRDVVLSIPQHVLPLEPIMHRRVTVFAVWSETMNILKKLEKRAISNNLRTNFKHTKQHFEK